MSTTIDYNTQFNNINKSNSEYVSSIFSKLQSDSSSSDSGLIVNLDDCYQIKSGTYGRLLKKHYADLKAAKKEEANPQDDVKDILSVKDSADTLKKAANTLKSSSFEKVTKTVTDKDGKTTTTNDYDWDKLAKNVSNFISSYNSVVKDTDDVTNSKTINRVVGNMTGYNVSNSKILSDIGINIKDDSTLEFDENTFKKADISKIESVFKGSYSYADSIARDASYLSNSALTQALGQSGSNTFYSQSGGYSGITNGSSFDSTF